MSSLKWFWDDFTDYRPTIVFGEYDKDGKDGLVLSIDAKMPTNAADDEYIEIGGFNSVGFAWPAFKVNYGPSLRIYKNGKWEMYGYTTDKVEKPLPLALEGVLPNFNGNAWHTYKIEIGNDKVTGYVNGVKLGTITESRGTVGLYISSGWNNTRFDNLMTKTYK